MIANTDFKKIAELLEKADNILLFPHENADGDSIGSCTALCLALRSKGKNVWVLTGEEPADYISFLDMGCCTTDAGIMVNPDVCMAIDCSEDQRLSWRLDKYNSAEVRICVDHHEAADGYGDYYYINPDEAAAAQLIYMIIRELKDAAITPEIAKAVFSGISSDTGNFRYSNTSPQSHRIAAELMEAGFDHNDVIVRLYQNKDMREVMMKAKALKVMERIAGGRGVVSFVTCEMREECGAEYGHVETVIDELRDIEGIEIAAVLKEKEPGVIKCSMRAKTSGNVEQIARVFGGGGHIKAAGCTFRDISMNQALDALKCEIERALR